MATDGTISNLAVRLRMDSSTFQQDISGAITAMSGMTRKVTASVAQLGRDMTTRLTLPIGASGAAAVTMAADYEQSMNQIIALTGNTRSQLEGMRGDVMKLAGDTAQSPKALADSLYFLASGGIEAENQMAVLESSAKAAAVGLGQTQDVARVTAAVLNAYAGTGLDAARATDVLVAAVQEGTAEANEMASSIGGVTPIAATLGVEFDQVASAISGITLSGATASEAVTQLASLMSSMIKPTKQGNDALKSIGMTFEDLREMVSQDLLGALNHLKVAFDGDTESLNKLIGRREGILGFLNLTGENADKIAGIFDRTTQETGQLTEALNVMSKDPSFRVKRAFESMATASVMFGQAILPAVASVFDAIASLATAIAQLPPPFLAAVAGVGAFVAALGPAIWMAGAFFNKLMRLRLAMDLLSLAMNFATVSGKGFFASMKLLVVTGIHVTRTLRLLQAQIAAFFAGMITQAGGASAALGILITGVAAHIKMEIGGIMIIVGQHLVTLSETALFAGGVVGEAFEHMGDKAVVAGWKMQGSAKAGIAALNEMTAAGMASSGMASGGVTMGFIEALTKRWKAMGVSAKVALDGMIWRLAIVRGRTAGMSMQIRKSFASIAGAIFDVVRHPLRSLGAATRSVGGVFRSVGRGIMGAWGMLGKVLLHPIQSIFALGKAVRGIVPAVAGALRVFAKWTLIGTFIIAVVRKIWGGFRTFIDWIKSNISKAVEWFRGLWSQVEKGGGVIDWIKKALSALMGAFKVLEDIIMNAFGVIWRVVEPFVALFFSVVGNGITAIVKLLQGDFSGAWKAVQRIAGDAIGGIIKLLVELLKVASGVGKGIVDAFDWILGGINFDESTGGLDPLIKDMEKLANEAYGWGETTTKAADKGRKAVEKHKSTVEDLTFEQRHLEMVSRRVMNAFAGDGEKAGKAFSKFVNEISSGVSDISGIFSTLVGDMKTTGHDIEREFEKRIEHLRDFHKNIREAAKKGLDPVAIRELMTQAMTDPKGAAHIAEHLNLEEGTRKAANQSIRVLRKMGQRWGGELMNWGKYGAKAFDPAWTAELRKLNRQIRNLEESRARVQANLKNEPGLQDDVIGRIDGEIRRRQRQIDKLTGAADGIKDVTDQMEAEGDMAGGVEGKLAAIEERHRSLGDAARVTARDLEKIVDQLNNLSSFTGDGVGNATATVKGIGDGMGLGGISGPRSMIAKMAMAAVPGDQAITSGFRPGAVTSYGNQSYHADPNNPAQDIGGENLMGIFQWLMANYMNSIKELIYTPAGFSIKNGRIVPPIAASDHYDHVHFADKGGIFKGPGVVAIGSGYETFAGGLKGAKKVRDLDDSEGRFVGSMKITNWEKGIAEIEGRILDRVVSRG